MKKELDEIIADNAYPRIPFDTLTHQIPFDGVLECPGIPKAALFNRVKEWCAIVYGNINSVLHYEDLGSGKIIVKGFDNVSYKYQWENIFGNMKNTNYTIKVNHTLVCTVKDGKVKFEFRITDYTFISAGYMTATGYIQGTSINRLLSDFYPIVDTGNPSQWRNNVSLIQSTYNTVLLSKTSLHNYLLRYEADYKF